MHVRFVEFVKLDMDNLVVVGVVVAVVVAVVRRCRLKAPTQQQ